MVLDQMEAQKKKITQLIDKSEEKLSEKMRQMEFDLNNNFVIN